MSVDDQLRAQVYADPDADAPREVYADYLLQQGDPLGELIVLQLERARSGGVVLPRELALLQELDRRPAGPLATYLTQFSVERGFPAKAMPVPLLPADIAHHPAWATVQRLEIASLDDMLLLSNPHLRPGTLAAREEVLYELSFGAEPLPFTALTAINPKWGLTFEPGQAMVFENPGAFDQVRALSLSTHLDVALGPGTELFRRPMMRRLEHLDLVFHDLRHHDLEGWVQWFPTSWLSRLTFQAPLALAIPSHPNPLLASSGTHYACISLERGRPLTLQLEEPTEARHVESLRRALVPFGGDTIEVHDLGHPSHIAMRQVHALRMLRELFREMIVVRHPMRSLVP